MGAEEDGEKEAEAKPMEINAEDIDVASVEDVMDLGNGEPLFHNFVYEDWVLLSTRFEFNLLIHAFRKDLDDPERPSFVEAHFAFYYNKYFNKANISLHVSTGQAGTPVLLWRGLWRRWRVQA